MNNCWWGWQNRTAREKCTHLYNNTWCLIVPCVSSYRCLSLLIAHIPRYLQSVINVYKYSRKIIIRNSLSKSWWWNRWLMQLWSWLYHNLVMESGGWSGAWPGNRLDAVLLKIMLSFRFEGFCFLGRWLWDSHVWVRRHKPECLVKKLLCCGHGHSKDSKLHWMFAVSYTHLTLPTMAVV